MATTTATDYRTWRSELTAGLDAVDGVTVRRFAVERPRAWDFKLYERRAFGGGHTLDDERAFIDAQGPFAPELLDFIFRRGRDRRFRRSAKFGSRPVSRHRPNRAARGAAVSGRQLRKCGKGGRGPAAAGADKSALPNAYEVS